MSLENATYIWQLNITNPTGTDPVSEGDDHLRMIKKTLQNSFPNMTAPWVTTSPVGVGTPTTGSHAVPLDYFNANIPKTDPIGYPRIWLLPTLPSADYMDLEGQALSRTTYATLFALYGTKYGAGDGSTTFNIPDLRGYFLRVWANGATTDPDKTTRTNRGDGTTGNQVGTKQADATRTHTHSYTDRWLGTFLNGTGHASGDNYGPKDEAKTTGATGGNETRPLNVYIRMIMRVR